MSRDSYTSPLSGRYPSKEMKYIWSDENKFRTWRRLWLSLAKAEKKLGLVITDEQIAQLEANVDNINYEAAAAYERRLRHDVMANILAYGDVAPLAKPIIHWGATSCYVTDNTDLIQIQNGLALLTTRIARVISRLCNFALQHCRLPTLAFTHFQPGQPTTVGKRACMWAQDLLLDLRAIEGLIETLQFRGVKGTTGTQDSFLKLFKGDHQTVKKLDELVATDCGFSKVFLICGQTYTRKQDSRVIFALSDFGATATKMCTDLRLLQNRKEIEEPFEPDQVGSTAMAYKRNPMRAERACSLARILISHAQNALQTHAQQWLERTLDDSAARRIFLADSFLLADSVALILQNVCEGLVVYPKVIERNLLSELPFMATEEIMMAMVEAGADRQECHERIRQHSQTAGKRVKQEGLDNNLLSVLAADTYFAPVHEQLSLVVDPSRFIGRAAEQTEEFVAQCRQALEPYSQERLAEKSELTV